LRILAAGSHDASMATMDAPPHLLTVPQVADELGLSKRTVRRRIADGEIRL
jgi:predicted DNA-binding transcriptional regulator AlpA